MIVLKIIYLHNYSYVTVRVVISSYSFKQTLPMYNIIHDDIFEIHLFSQIIKLVLIIYYVYYLYLGTAMML